MRAFRDAVAARRDSPHDDGLRTIDSALFGGRYVPETLIPALDELERAYDEARADPAFTCRARRRCSRTTSAVRRR